jgi:hypothetical protein
LYSHEEERDDLDIFVTKTLVRLNFASLLSSASGGDKERLRSELSERVMTWKRGLASDSAWVQRECCWKLASVAVAETAWHWIAELLRSPHVPVRQEVLLFLSQEGRSGEAPPEVVGLLEARRVDEDRECRRVAAGIVARRRIADGDLQGVVQAMVKDEDAPRIDACFLALLANRGPAWGPACAPLVPYLKHANKELRAHARHLVQFSFQNQWADDSIVPAILDIIRGDDPFAATSALGAMHGYQRQCPEIAALVERWLDDKEADFTAMGLLENQARLGTDLSRLLPALEARLLGRQRQAETCKVLLQMLAHAKDKRPVIRAMLPGLNKDWATSLYLALWGLVERGLDLSELLPELEGIDHRTSRHLRSHQDSLVGAIKKKMDGGEDP